MQSRGGRGPCNPPFPHASRVAAANDGTLNAIVNNSVCSVDVPLGNVGSHQDDEMLSLLQYPVSDSLDRGYCSDIFGDLPYTSAHLARQSLSEVPLTPLNAPFNAGTSVFSVNLSHEKHRSCASINNTCTAMSENKRGATESCGSGSVEASLRVAGADAVSGLGLCQAAGATPSLGPKLDPQEGHAERRVEQAEQPLCESSSANSSLFCMQSESNQTRSKATSQQEASAGTSRIAPKLMVSNGCYSLPMPAGKYARTNFALFARPALQSKVNLHVLGEGSGPSNIERVRQQPVDHLMNQEAMSPCTTPIDVRTGQAKLWGFPAPLPPPLPLPCAPTPQGPPLSSAPFALDSRIATLDAPDPLHSLAPPPSVHEAVDDLNSNKDTASGSKVSAVSAEKGAHTADQIATSPSQGSGSCAERTGIGTDKPFGHDVGLQSVEEMAAEDKKYPSHAKRLRTAEMHNQSERSHAAEAESEDQ